MGLGSVLVDRARVIENRETPYRVEGTTRFEVVAGPWFRARLTMPSAPRRQAAGQAPGSERKPSLLFKLRDEENGLVVLTVNTRVEVDSTQLGRAVYELSADPEPMRKRRRVIGYLANLQRVENFSFDPIPGVEHPVGLSLRMPYRVFM